MDGSGNVLLTGSMVEEAEMQAGAVDAHSSSQPYVSIVFNEEGTKRFAEATKENLDKIIYIVMDDEVISAPVVQTAINH